MGSGGVSGTVTVSRRAILLGALAATACHTGEVGTIPSASSARAGAVDAHTHFFNLADLPVAGFVTHVLLGQYTTPPEWAAGMIDFITGMAKRFAKSAQQEANALGILTELDARAFGEAAATYVDERLATASAASGEEADLVQSYEALLRALEEDTDTAVTPSTGGTVAATAVDSKRRAFQRAAEMEERQDAVTAGFNPVAAVGAVGRTIGWVSLMIRSRETHIKAYLKDQPSSDREPRAMASLLVDYDLWLDDTPAAGSAPLDQIRIMHLLRGRMATRADIRLFAGICPLRLALSRAKGKPALFDDIKGELAAGRVHGFKIYPPMGFRATDNAALDNVDFDPAPSWRVTAWDRWRNETGNIAPHALGQALDAALDEVYAHAARKRVPIVAHAGSGNAAGKGFGARANPIYWERVVARHPICLSIGHLVNDATPFIKAMRGERAKEGVWALDAPLRMLNRNQPNPPDIYGDLAYMPELNDAEICKAFFEELANAFRPGDAKLERILYGTDWIMYGREAHSDQFLSVVERGMRAARYTGEQIDNILWNNGKRFLGVA